MSLRQKTERGISVQILIGQEKKRKRVSMVEPNSERI